MNLKTSARAAWEIVVARRWFRILPFTLGAVLGIPGTSPASESESLSSAPESEARELTAYRSVKTAPHPFYHARLGMPRFDVLVGVGAPDQKLGSNVWVYWNVKSNQPGDTARGYDTMVLCFTNDKLSQLRLVEGRALKSLIASLAAKTPPPIAKR